MQTQTLDTATDSAVKLAHLKHEVGKAKIIVSDLVEDGKRNAERMVKRGRAVAEDYMDDATHYIKHHPWQSMGVAAGFGVGAGMLAAWACSRVFAMNHRCATLKTAER